MDAANLDQTELDQIAEEFSEEIRRGLKPTIADYLKRYPDPSGQLRNLLASVAMIEGLKSESSKAVAKTAPELMKLSQLDDYSIVREIGRGGMGVVFEAIHQSLGRRVAVKVLARDCVGDTKNLVRFRREARAAARLRHSNIVPVFGVGQDGEHHYYVMDYIDGMSLRGWLESIAAVRSVEEPTRDNALSSTAGKLSLPPAEDRHDAADAPADELSVPNRTDTPEYYRWAARLVMSVCDALQYAHTQGVLHRDIKPANLLIDRHAVVWVADFGLAKLIEQPAMTMTGDIVGTPQYMAPESFEGHFDVRSEIYCVGLTLHELLTQRPAIRGKNAVDVIRKASAGVSASPRKENQHVPRDLETIVLKALARDPRSRYVTAGDLRDDLRRFLTDRPIQARRTGPLERAIRWSRREPAIATLTFATFILLFALAVVSVIGYLQTKDALDGAQVAQQSAETSLEQRTVALAAADAQRMRAENNLQVALNAFDAIMQNITDQGIEPDAEYLGEVTDTTSPHVTPEDAELLQSLLGFFDDLAANNSDDLLAESASAARRAGDIYLRLGQLRQADRAYSDALDRYHQLAQREADSAASVIARAEIMNELAVIAGLRGRLAYAAELFGRTLTLLQDSDPAMASDAGRFAYARAHRLFASLGARAGIDGVSPKFPRAERRPPGPRGEMIKRRTDEELRAIDEAITTLDALIEGSPEEVRYRAELARSYRDKAKVASRAKRRSVAEESVQRSLELFDQLYSENKESDAIRYEFAMTLASTEALGFNQMLRAIQANELSTALLEQSPDLPRYRALKAHTLATLAAHQQSVGKLEQAEDNLMETLQIYSSLIAESPELRLYETRRSQTLEEIADVKLRQGDRETAISYLERAIRRLQPRLRRPEISPVVKMQLQRMHQKLNRIRSES
jgi:serine/threonine protein kinase/tetratricopeptide (TPR) repeat protein